MRPLFKIALAILIGASIVTIYKIYEKKRSRKPGRKITRHVKRQCSEDDAHNEQRIVHDTSSDILHPAPFDNVLGRMPKAGEPTSPRKQRHVDKKTGKLSGRKSDSEMREIDQQDILFQTCQYVRAPEGTTPSTTSSAPTTTTTTTTTMPSSSKSGSSASGVSESTQSVTSPAPKAPPIDDLAKSHLTPPPAPIPPDTNRKALAEPPTPSLRDEGSHEPVTPRKSADDVNRKALAEPPVLSAESAAAPPLLIPPSATSSAKGEMKKKSSPSSSETGKEKSREKTNSKTKYKLCRCRFNNRNTPIEDKDSARFVAETKLDIAPTTILPVVFSRYTPQNLLEPHGDVMELPDECFKTDPEMADNYLTPFHPIINATSAAHYHACLISHLIENYDFFE